MNSKSFLATKTFILIIGTFLIGAAIYMFLVNPEFNKLKDAANRRDDAQLKLLENDKKEELLSQAEKEYQTIKADLDKISIAIPKDSDTGLMVAAIEQVAADTGISISNLSTSVRAKKISKKKDDDKDKKEDEDKPASSQVAYEEDLLSKYHATVYSISFSGGYPNIIAFLDHITNLDRYSILSSLQLANNGETSDSLTASIVFWTYHQNPAKEIPIETSNEDTKD